MRGYGPNGDRYHWPPSRPRTRCCLPPPEIASNLPLGPRRPPQRSHSVYDQGVLAWNLRDTSGICISCRRDGDRTNADRPRVPSLIRVGSQETAPDASIYLRTVCTFFPSFDIHCSVWRKSREVEDTDAAFSSGTFSLIRSHSCFFTLGS